MIRNLKDSRNHAGRKCDETGVNDKDSEISPSTAMRRKCLCMCNKDDSYRSSEM